MNGMRRFNGRESERQLNEGSLVGRFESVVWNCEFLLARAQEKHRRGPFSVPMAGRNTDSILNQEAIPPPHQPVSAALRTPYTLPHAFSGARTLPTRRNSLKSLQHSTSSPTLASDRPDDAAAPFRGQSPWSCHLLWASLKVP